MVGRTLWLYRMPESFERTTLTNPWQELWIPLLFY